MKPLEIRGLKVCMPYKCLLMDGENQKDAQRNFVAIVHKLQTFCGLSRKKSEY